MPVETTKVAGKVPTAYERLLDQYSTAGQGFQIAQHYYYSTGAFMFEIINTAVDPGGYTRLVLRCPGGSKIDLFSYGLQDQVTGVNLGAALRATDAETNLSERHQTNNEDFAIEGMSCGSRGVRISYPNAATAGPLVFTNPDLRQQLVQGTLPWSDLGAQLLPPEFASPLALHDALFECLKPMCSVQINFDRKATDRLARLDQIPQGGARAYLLANGEPSTHNFRRIPEGYVWRKAAEQIDRLLTVTLTVEQDVWATCTLPNLFQPVSPALSALGAPGNLWLELTLVVIGRAFYLPSKNM